MNGKFNRRIGEQTGKASWSNSRKNLNLKEINVFAFNVSEFSSEKMKQRLFIEKRVFSVSDIRVRQCAALLSY